MKSSEKSSEKKDLRVKRSVFSFRYFIVVFLFISFLFTTSIMLFMQGMPLVEETVRVNAKRTLGNIVFLSFLVTVIVGIYRRITVEKPVKRILSATKRIGSGDFSHPSEPFHKGRFQNEYDVILADLNKMSEDLSGVETMRVDFIANVSHEMKTPLSVLQNYSTLLSQPDLGEEDRLIYAKGVSDATRRMTSLISNMLRLNKLENQQIFPQKEEYNLSEQLCEVLLTFEDLWEKEGIDVETDIPENVLIRSDPELLYPVFVNILSNAFKFTPAGGKIGLTLLETEKNVSVTVTDTGCGMTEEEQRRIFEKFYQGDTSHSVSGNGLGLALVKRISEILDFQITVESEKGAGSRFTVILKKA